MVLIHALFPLVWAWGIAISSTMINFFTSKPILNKTLVDLINSDLMLGHAMTLTFYLLPSYLSHVHSSELLDVPKSLVLVVTWMFQVWALYTILYMSYSIMIRYIYLYNQRMILEEVSDETLRKATRYFTLLVSGCICVGLHFSGRSPSFYLDFIKIEKGFHVDSGFVFPIITTASLLINLILRIKLWKAVQESSSPDEQDKARLIKRLAFVLVFVLAVATTGRVTNLSNQGNALMIVSFMNVACMAYMIYEEPIRKHACKLLRKNMPNLSFKCTVPINASNAVAPSAN